MKDLFEVLEKAGPWVAFFLAALVYIAAPVLRDILKERYSKKLERANARHTSITEINREYFKKRIDAYLGIWSEFTSASRSLFSAGSYNNTATWSDALKDLEKLTNYFYDNRPLVSRRVFHFVVELRELRRRFSRDERTRSGVWDRHRWNAFRASIQRVQREVLHAIALDLEEQGLNQIVKNLGVQSTAQVRDENRLSQLVRFVVRGQASHPYVGLQFLKSHFVSQDPKELDELLAQAQELGWLELFEFPEPKSNETIKAVRPLLSEARVRELVDGQVAADAESMMELHDWGQLIPRFIYFLSQQQSRPGWSYVSEGYVAKNFDSLSPKAGYNLISLAGALGVVERYSATVSDGTVKAIRLVETHPDVLALIGDVDLAEDSDCENESAEENTSESGSRPVAEGNERRHPSRPWSAVPESDLVPGAVVSGEVVKCQQDYVLVRLSPTLTAMCHIADVQQDDPQVLVRDYPIGTFGDWEVVRVDRARPRINLRPASVSIVA